ncbi:MAG: Mur ligase family protein [Oscillospiraceae bacterium]
MHGAREDGADYAKEAAARGAVCVVTEHAAEGVPCVLVPDAHEAAAKLAARWYGEPAGRMTVVGVTGTNGKTTTTYLLKQLLERCLGAKVGLIGTNQNMIGDAVLPAERTTPDALTLQRLLREMADAGCTHVVMEVSSHALVQRRAGAIDFALGVFTNLTQDHLDYHGTMEAYCDAKARLFRQCRAAAVNGDDPWTPRLLENVTCPVTRFGQGLANDLVGWDAHYCADRVSFHRVQRQRAHPRDAAHSRGVLALQRARRARRGTGPRHSDRGRGAGPLTLSGRARQGGGGADGHGLHRAH